MKTRQIIGSLSVSSCLTLASCTTPLSQETPDPKLQPVHELPPLSSRPAAPKSASIKGLQRGINLGNYLDSPKGTNWRPDGIGDDYLAHLSQLGFDHVRLPVRFADYALEQAPFTIDEGFFKKVDDAIASAHRHKLSVILDFHHYEKIMHEPEAHRARAIALWEQIAQRYQKQALDTLLFEPMNEPMDKLAGDVWNSIASDLIQTIRKSNPKRLIIVDSAYWAAASRLPELKLPSPKQDPNIVPSFHMYEPYLFTHQGAPWSTPKEMTATKAIVFPGPGPKPVAIPSAIGPDLAWVRDWLNDYNKKPVQDNPSGMTRIIQEFAHVDKLIQQGYRVYLGEFGAIEYADMKSRENYVRLIREEAERRNIAWCYWDDGGAFKVIDRKKGDVLPLRAALLNETSAK